MNENRADIPAKYKWDLSAIYENMDAFEKDYKKAEDLIEAFSAHAHTMAKGAKELYEMFCDKTQLERIIDKLYIYAHLNADLDLSNNFYQALMGRMRNLVCSAGSAAFFVSPTILKISKETTEKWMKEFPPLAEYKREIETEQRYRPHTLSDENEKLLADMQMSLGSHSNIRTVFANAELSFGRIKDEEKKLVELTEATYVLRLMSEDRRVRRAAFKKLYQSYDSFGNTLSALIDSYVKERVTLSKIRGFENSQTASVFRDEVTPDIYDNLIETVSDGLEPLFDYYDLKKEVLGLSKLHMYDVYTPLISSCTREYSFDEATEEVLNTVGVFGSEYQETLRKGIKEENWVDVYPSKGKRGGAYSSGCYDTAPYMLLNYTGKLDDVSTFAHEAGHSMHSYLSAKANTPQESSYTIFVAEVASTVNELLFAHKKLRESDSDEEKLSILNQIMETYKGTLYRQTMFAEFEKTMHSLCEQGETLTKELLCEKYYSLIEKYFGGHVVADKEIALEWMRIPHFYSWFYVYKYSTCISAASSIVRRIENEGESYIKKYLDFLGCGGRLSPLDSLKVAEIDLTKPEVIRDAISDFAETVKAFRELYNKNK
ncbi:MAG: oligoendopeptidase F [Clostridia bacterium]|nr:oligoendopeptidase F [Clostridia bacterium]